MVESFVFGFLLEMQTFKSTATPKWSNLETIFMSNVEFVPDSPYVAYEPYEDLNIIK